MNLKSGLPGSMLHLLVTGVVGFLYFLLGQVLYPTLTERIWQPLGIALYFFGFALIILIAMFVLNQIRGDYSFWVRNNSRDEWLSAYKVGFLCVAIILAVGGVLEFLYELGPVQSETATSYVFVIDDSGSMSGNDPEMRRVQAIDIMMSKDPSLPYAVYAFTEDATLLKDMGSYTQDFKYSFESEGNTNILTSLNSVIEDIKNGRLKGGSAPRILLLSDGESSHFGWREITSDSRSCNTTISAIGFGYDSSLLRNIAERTGGVFLQVDDLDDLSGKMKDAMTSFARRNLISSRAVSNNDWLYAILRVVFLLVIGLIWSWMKYETYCSANAGLNRRVFIASVACCTISSVLLEVLLQDFWLPPALARMFFCIFWAITPGFFASNDKIEESSSASDSSPWGDTQSGSRDTTSTIKINESRKQRVSSLRRSQQDSTDGSPWEGQPLLDTSWDNAEDSIGDIDNNSWGQSNDV